MLRCCDRELGLDGRILMIGEHQLHTLDDLPPGMSLERFVEAVRLWLYGHFASDVHFSARSIRQAVAAVCEARRTAA